MTAKAYVRNAQNLERPSMLKTRAARGKISFEAPGLSVVTVRVNVRP